MAKQGRRSEAKAEKRKEEAKRLNLEREKAGDRRSRWVRIGRALACLTIFTAVGVVFLTHSWTTRERVTGRLAGVREVSFSPRNPEGGGISPVCGCLDPPFNKWRGVTFAAREAVISREGDSPLTEWTISGAEAKEGIDPVPAAQQMAVEVVQMDPVGRFDPAWMINGEFARHGRILSNSSFEALMLSIVTDGRLRVGLLGNVPIGSWIPLPGSRVELTAGQAPFPETPPVPQLTEHYPPSMGWPAAQLSGHAVVRGQGYPVGDFLGPDLVLWSTAPFVEVSGGPREKAQQGRGLVTAILLKGSTFSTRIGAVPLTWSELRKFVARGSAISRRGRETGVAGYPDDGKVTIEVTKPLGRGAYSDLRHQVLAHPVVSMSPLTRVSVFSERSREVHR